MGTSCSIYLGRLCWGQGDGYLLEAFESLRNRCAEPINLLFVGDEPAGARLRQGCAERGISGGFQQKAGLLRYSTLADVLVFPTLGDPCGLVVG